MIKDIPLISVGFDGYSLDHSLKSLVKTGSTRVSLCCVDGFTQHVIPERLDLREWEKIKILFQNYGLKFYGLEGHCNVSDSDNLKKIEKRLEFTHFMEGEYLDLNAGPKGSEMPFYSNIDRIARRASELNIMVFLETHGDLIDSIENGAKVIEKINSERIKICYDPANVYFYSNGEINPIADIKHGVKCLGILHFKGVSHNQDKSEWTFPLMRDSIFDYNDFFQVLKNCDFRGPYAIEIEKMFRFEKAKGFIRDPQWPEDKIVEAYKSELEFLHEKL
jgi:sugar phosphate isomerase/epimerase